MNFTSFFESLFLLALSLFIFLVFWIIIALRKAISFISDKAKYRYIDTGEQIPYNAEYLTDYHVWVPFYKYFCFKNPQTVKCNFFTQKNKLRVKKNGTSNKK